MESSEEFMLIPNDRLLEVSFPKTSHNITVFCSIVKGVGSEDYLVKAGEMIMVMVAPSMAPLRKLFPNL